MKAFAGEALFARNRRARRAAALSRPSCRYGCAGEAADSSRSAPRSEDVPGSALGHQDRDAVARSLCESSRNTCWGSTRYPISLPPPARRNAAPWCTRWRSISSKHIPTRCRPIARRRGRRCRRFLDAQLAPYAQEFPDIHADWLPRLTRIAMALVDWEYQRRDRLARVHVELRGGMEIPFGSRTFRLTARADRIEQRRDGGVTALDFKSGKPPSAKEISVGFLAAAHPRSGDADAGRVQGDRPGRRDARTRLCAYRRRARGAERDGRQA